MVDSNVRKDGLDADWVDIEDVIILDGNNKS